MTEQKEALVEVSKVKQLEYHDAGIFYESKQSINEFCRTVLFCLEWVLAM